MEPGAPPPPGCSLPPPPPPPPPVPADSRNGIILGKYKLGKLLGRGSFAKVYQAVSLDDNNNNNNNSGVAIKIIDKTKPITSLMEPHIVREVSVMRRLQPHPNILKIHEVMATKSKIYLVMEIASGGELFSKITRRGRLNEPTARRYFQQLVSALHFCHQNGVAHRDIKPQNLLLDKNGVLKVSDFGLSALPEQRRNGLLHTACGTPAYTAPEVVCRGGYDGTKADAWSCGVILYVLLAGHLPFDDNNLVSMYKKTRQRGYSFPDCISKPARFLINRLLDPNPSTRMTLEELMKTPWFKKNLNTKFSEEKPETILKDNNKFDVVSGMNAFDIISMSSGLDLSGLFETSNKKGKRFTSSASYEVIAEKMGEVGSKLGYRIEKGKGGGVIGLGKGRLVMLAVVLEIAESLVLVEVKVIEGGVDSEEEVQWGSWIDGLKEIVLSWHNDVI